MLFGLIICLILAALSTFFGSLQHIVGAPIIGLFLGMISANCAPQSFLKRVQKGAAFSSKRVLRVGIILAGGTLSFKVIIGAGGAALPYIIFSIVLAFVIAYIIGKGLKVAPKTSALVGCGTAICGGTAIATLSAIIEAKEDEMAYAMTSIFLFDIIAALIWPYVAISLGFSPEQFSILAGIAINDVASVTAAGGTFNHLMGAAAYGASGVSGGDLAVIVKLTRVAMLVVVAIVATIVYQAQKQKNADLSAQSGCTNSVLKNIIKAFPFYVLGFLLLAILNTVVDFSGIKLFESNLGSILKIVYKFFITAALVGVGHKIKLKELFTKGAKPVLLGGCTWAAVSICTLVYISAFLR